MRTTLHLSYILIELRFMRTWLECFRRGAWDQRSFRPGSDRAVCGRDNW